MALKRVDFRAEFKTKLEADHDWLYFDLTCYCGEEQITREKLLSYLQSGDPFYRREDGTMVTIANRETLEGLTRLLQNFQAQEDGAADPSLMPLSLNTSWLPRPTTKRYGQKFSNLYEEVQTGKPVKPIKLQNTLRAYSVPIKRRGELASFLRSYHFGGILADDMGWGKRFRHSPCLRCIASLANPPSLFARKHWSITGSSKRKVCSRA